MKVSAVPDYDVMSQMGADIIFDVIAPKLLAGKTCNLGLATGNTMITLYRILAEKLNAVKADLSLLHTWNLDEYAIDEKSSVPADHPLSYFKYMNEKFFSRFDPALGFTPANAHFPSPDGAEEFDRALESRGGLALQLLGIGFNGHIAFNEPMKESEISVENFGLLPTRVLPLTQDTIDQNTKVTANGDASLVPHFAATMGMKPILKAKKELLLACFAEQEAPLRKMFTDRRVTPELPASYLLDHPDFQFIYTADKINLDDCL